MAKQHTVSSRSAAMRPQRDLWRAVTKGWSGRCPHCGTGPLFKSFLKPVHHCESCGEEMHHHRADDLPPYLVIFIVGHVVVAGYMIAEPFLDWNSWQHLAMWIPITLAMALAMIQPVKGAVIGLQWANYMHGFGGEEDEAAEIAQGG
ncbi:DUF983 domain-containing protein [Hoeflea poritis]|uniref:DUF983 domain-containing protein n=1 Tax=Hoeflea poritis TaxID=2993659 RepID=A0ABT4VPZ1_9HYPH|nr:DUF983 domain-containing protein [Hoeflea poritis]MDA4846778.1 DUF983 domain-containing protein [Hoeflea poritis]